MSSSRDNQNTGSTEEITMEDGRVLVFSHRVYNPVPSEHGIRVTRITVHGYKINPGCLGSFFGAKAEIMPVPKGEREGIKYLLSDVSWINPRDVEFK